MVALRGRMITDQGVLEEINNQFKKNSIFRAMLRNAPKATIIGLGIVVPEGLELAIEGSSPDTELLCVVAQGE